MSRFHDITQSTKILIAYLLHRNPQTTTTQQIRSLIQQELPKGIYLSANPINNLRQRRRRLLNSDEMITSIEESRKKRFSFS